MGQATGRGIVQRIGLEGNDAEAIAKLFNAFFKEANWESEGGVTVEDSKVALRAGYVCPIMVSAMSLKLPWDWLDQNFAWPMMKGVASAVNPSIEFKVGKTRYKGDPICEHFVVMK